jgi:hypothetical protein
MKVPEDGQKYGLKHVAVIKQNPCRLVYFEIFVVLTAGVSQTMTHNRMHTLKTINYLTMLKYAFLICSLMVQRERERERERENACACIQVSEDN